MTHVHPTYAMRDAALREHCWHLGIDVGDTSDCRSLGQQIRLYGEKPRLAANPYSWGSVTPWGWRYRGSLHMEQVDGWCHAIDYTIAARPKFNAGSPSDPPIRRRGPTGVDATARARAGTS